MDIDIHIFIHIKHIYKDFTIQNSEFRIQNAEFWIQNGFATSCAKTRPEPLAASRPSPRILNAEFWIQNGFATSWRRRSLQQKKKMYPFF